MKKKKEMRLTVEKLIGILKKCKHKRKAIVTFTDVIIQLKDVLKRITH